MTAMWQISTRGPVVIVDAVTQALEEYAVSVSTFETGVPGLMQIDAITLSEPDPETVERELRAAAKAAGGAIDAVGVERLPEVDWLAENRSSFPPMRIGRFIIHGSHLDVPPRGLGLGIHMDAALAFGSGSHATTEGCMRLLQHWAKARRVRSVLDIGCGSGILAIAAARLWGSSRVLAADIDPVATRTAADNFRINRIADRARALTAVGSDHPEIWRRAPYQVVCANILAEPLRQLAPDLTRCVEPGGAIILSGLLTRDERLVIAAYLARGFRLEKRCRIAEWSALLLVRR